MVQHVHPNNKPKELRFFCLKMLYDGMLIPGSMQYGITTVTVAAFHNQLLMKLQNLIFRAFVRIMYMYIKCLIVP